jgi:hypothetical protein
MGMDKPGYPQASFQKLVSAGSVLRYKADGRLIVRQTFLFGVFLLLFDWRTLKVLLKKLILIDLTERLPDIAFSN